MLKESVQEISGLVPDRVRIWGGGLSLCHTDVVRTKQFHLFLHQNPTKLSKCRQEVIYSSLANGTEGPASDTVSKTPSVFQ